MPQTPHHPTAPASRTIAELRAAQRDKAAIFEQKLRASNERKQHPSKEEEQKRIDQLNFQRGVQMVSDLAASEALRLREEQMCRHAHMTKRQWIYHFKLQHGHYPDFSGIHHIHGIEQREAALRVRERAVEAREKAVAIREKYVNLHR